MPCRDTPLVGVAQTLARRGTTIDDVQMLSLFGELKRSGEARATPPPTDAEWQSLCRRLSAHVVQQGIAEPRRTRYNTIITDASTTRPDGATFYALTHASRRAAEAEMAIGNQLQHLARRHNTPATFLQEGMRRLVTMNRAVRRADNPPQPPECLPFAPDGIPADRATRWALTMLYSSPSTANPNSSVNREIATRSGERASTRCAECGQFTGWSPHMCDPSTTTADVGALGHAEHQQSAPSVTDVEPGIAAANSDPVAAAEPALAPTTPDDSSEGTPLDRPAGSLRRYRLADGTGIRLENRTSLLRRLRENARSDVDVPVEATFPGSRGMVSGYLTMRDRARGRWSSSQAINRYRVNVQELDCTCAEYRRNYMCPHIQQTVRAASAWLNDEDVSQFATPPEQPQSDLRQGLTASRDSAELATQAARARFEENSDGIAYADDMAAFQTDWEAVRGRRGQGGVTYMREDVTGGLGARDGGRSFGLEIEIDFPNDQPVLNQRTGTYTYGARAELARRMHEAGVSQWDQPLSWHGLRAHPDQDGNVYSDQPNRWSVQFDRSVDGLDGVRGAEIVSPILYDEPQTWDNLNTIVGLVHELGGQVTVRTGLHVNVGASDFNHTIENHDNLLRMTETFEDTLIRCATNPENGPWHRGRSYCTPVRRPSVGFQSINDARASNGHLSMVNLTAMPGEGSRVHSSTRVEFRQFDGTLDVGRIQGHTKMALAMMDAAKRGVDFSGDESEPTGTHRNRNFNGRRMPRLTGEAWEQDTRPFRRLVDMLFARRQDKQQAMELFASARWQQS